MGWVSDLEKKESERLAWSKRADILDRRESATEAVRQALRTPHARIRFIAMMELKNAKKNMYKGVGTKLERRNVWKTERNRITDEFAATHDELDEQQESLVDFVVAEMKDVDFDHPEWYALIHEVAVQAWETFGIRDSREGS